MNWITIALVSFATGVFASLGLGGGMILIIYLTLFAGLPQLQAQGINLVFFLPIAAVSLYFHTKNKLVEWKKIVPVIISGTIFVAIFSFMANAMDNTLLKRIFGVFVILAGIKELFSKKEKPEAQPSASDDNASQ
ncbi:sulfite exporter TauE/SafE family protein [Ruminococcus sp. Marseille-P6503]|uniref:sulfite exporter TauE/SafE family protein n=1 Tax=Ruminococcus sp. Marseille-P6503 TaxID=2364796 RepID=UPI000F5331AB|nr:sulfite exporter TauE/SafE family protein [Ruminococcus sp. Marseille-P6503]